MPDWEISLTCTKSIVGGKEQATVKSVVLEDFPRNTALTKGLDELFKWAIEEHSDNPENIPIPLKAIEYWEQCRANGNILLYEIQSNLEAWGITSSMKELTGDAPPATPMLAERNGHKPATRNGAPPKPTQKLDLRGILTQQLDLLQARQRDVIAERKRLQLEYDDNQESISDITAYLMINKTKKQKRKADAESIPDKD